MPASTGLNIAYPICFSFPLGVLISVLLSGVWLYMLESPDPRVIGHYSVGVLAFAVSACIEVLVEPLFVTGQVYLFIKLKVSDTAIQLSRV